MKLEDVTTGAPLTDCLSGTQAVAFSVLSDTDAGYRWIQGERVKFPYLTPSRQDKGVVIRYVMKVQRLLPSTAHPADPAVPQGRDTQAPSAHRGGFYPTIHTGGYAPAGGNGRAP